MRISKRNTTAAAAFKRAKLNKVLSLKPTVSTSHFSDPKRDPNVPRTNKQARVFVVNTFGTAQHVFGLRDGDKWVSLKTNPALCSFKNMDNTTRARLIKAIITSGSTPSAYAEMTVGLPARVIGAIRRWHNGDWRDQTNQHIRRENSNNRV